MAANYLQITIGEEKIGLNFGSHTNELIIKGENNGGVGLMSCSIPKVMYYAYLSNCERKSETPKLTKFDFYDFIDEVGGNHETPLLVYKTFLESCLCLVEDKKDATTELKSIIKEIEGKLTTLKKKK